MALDIPLIKFAIDWQKDINSELLIKQSFNHAINHSSPFFSAFEDHDTMFVKTTLYNWLKTCVENQALNEAPMKTGSWDEYYVSFHFPRYKLKAALHINFI